MTACASSPSTAPRTWSSVPAATRGGALFGSTFVFGESARADRSLRATRRRGTLGPAGTRADVLGWLSDAGFDAGETASSGGLLLFAGRRR